MSVSPYVQAEVETPAAADLEPVTAGGLRRTWRRFRRNPLAMGGLVFIVVLILVAVFAPLFARYDPTYQPHPLTAAKINAAPSASHWLGTDDVGRDILTRVIYGARVSLRAAFQIVALALALSVPIGLVSGYFGGRVDSLLSRLMDALFAFPPLVLALTIAALLGPSLNHATVAIGVVFVPGFVRLLRGQVLAVREETYIEASRGAGAGSMRMLRKHVLPNVASPLIVQASLSLGYAVLAEAGLSLLGVGVQLPTASWGQMLSRAYEHVFTAPLPLVFPGLALMLTVLAFNLIGDGLRDALGRERFRIATRT